ncbi:L,D-transpeptidase family protein [Budvicia diplopodorum]|uniref:L,D-transpeptidase family protein n=1 Tax=Budvicia diplopodorum TaxID=1119056 RepID=UPI00135C17C3|nr:murein L,D-transpeptidase family protein [Budvicia diplopodorum]
MRKTVFIVLLLLILLVSFFIYRNISDYLAMKNDSTNSAVPPSSYPQRPTIVIQPGDRLYIRLLKAEDKLELWVTSDGKKYGLYKTYVICAYSGGLGPKKVQGDMKSPEGFYSTDKRLLNPKSQYHLSFNIGYPNAFDRANGYTGDFLMVHGGCASVGCYAMTDPIITEIYGLVEQALNSGQKSIPIHIFPFAMTKENINNHRESADLSFWQSLKPAYDYFEKTRQVPVISVVDKRYKIVNN